MDADRLLADYRSGDRTPEGVVEAVYDRIEAEDTNAWIATRERADVMAEAAALADPGRPLYGVPFAVKDNIDYAGLPTTAGCPAYAYEPDEHAAVVERLIDAGALLVGKTNMDQFATGLVGTRTPYGACHNAFAPEFIAGGSSSGSAVTVARGHVAFALGTDTGGSGRVPAAFNGLVGLKPTRSAVSSRGVVPACASLDCVSVFARTTRDALRVERVAAGFDPADPYSRRTADGLDLELRPVEDARPVRDVRIGIPAADELTFFGDGEAEASFGETVDVIETCFGEPTTIDFEPFREAGELLYDGPWVAERLSAVGEFLTDHADEVDPVVADVIGRGKGYSARDTFEALHRLERLRRRTETILDGIDALVIPTTGTIYTLDEVRAEPIALNSNLGYYTNFVNLLDLAAVSIPTDRFAAGPSFGVTVVGDAFADARVAAIGAVLRERTAISAPEPVDGS
jgi:allophanate hydrolase